jgi:hypothetical protein
MGQLRKEVEAEWNETDRESSGRGEERDWENTVIDAHQRY